MRTRTAGTPISEIQVNGKGAELRFRIVSNEHFRIVVAYDFHRWNRVSYHSCTSDIRSLRKHEPNKLENEEVKITNNPAYTMAHAPTTRGMPKY